MNASRDARKSRKENLRERNGSRRERIGNWLFPIGGAVTAAAAPILFDFVPEGDDGVKNLLSFSGITFLVLTVAALGLLGIQVRRGNSTSQRRMAEVSSFGNALGDTFEALDRLMRSKKSANDKKVFFESVLSEIKALLPLQDPRACVYELDAPDTEDATEQLKFIASRGRMDKPRKAFTSDTEHGRDLIEIVKAGTWRCIDSVHAPDFKIDVRKESKWRSFMVVPFTGGDSGKSVLIIDTPALTTFTQDHRTISEAIARLLEIGMGSVVEAAQDTRPELASMLRTLASLDSNVSMAEVRRGGRRNG